jgi:hypothetical protein
MASTRKHRINSTNDLPLMHSQSDHQSGDSCAKKTVKHGDKVDDVHDGKIHRIHDKKVTSEEIQADGLENEANKKG